MNSIFKEYKNFKKKNKEQFTQLQQMPKIDLHTHFSQIVKYKKLIKSLQVVKYQDTSIFDKLFIEI